MLPIKEKFIVDENGTHVSVILDIADYHKLLEELEELSDICAALEAKASDEEFVPLEEVLAEIELLNEQESGEDNPLTFQEELAFRVAYREGYQAGLAEQQPQPENIESQFQKGYEQGYQHGKTGTGNYEAALEKFIQNESRSEKLTAVGSGDEFTKQPK